MTTPWTSDTSWTVPRGSLDSVVSFESFDFPIDSDSTRRKPPLLLLPPQSSDYEPCEIKLNFTQKHEIRQVYVRSTARVYEIYYASALQSDNEYLCTVRCSAASVEDNSFPATDAKEAISVNSDGPGDILPKARVAGENKIGTNEDDWVEVKLPDGPDQNSNKSRNHQDFFEATAEINDSEPCMSLTIRLLSLQTKGCVYVDEVYIFADPIDSSDSENQTVHAETSASSSLMTMLVPTLLGLTKSRTVQLHDQINSNPVGKPIKTELEPATSNNPVNHVHQQDETLRKPSEAKAELTQSQLPVSTPDKEFSYTRAETLLEQLVARVSRIEDICMRFEENMLKPINNMEARLERVEQQVELLARCPVSPSFSRLEPIPTSISNDGNASQLCGEPESEKTGSFSNGTHKSPEDTFMPTVQEFPCCDEKVEVNDVLESPKKEKPKKTVSIDDALAAALAGFSSFTKPNASFTVESIDTTCVSNTDGEEEVEVEVEAEAEAEAEAESLKATAPEFIEEEDDADPTCDASIEIPDNNFDSNGISQVDDEEAMGPISNFSCPSSPPHETDAQHKSINAVKILAFDKTDILKHFPDQPPDVSESRVDFESPILEVKFASFDNGSLKSPLEALLTDDSAKPATDEVVLIDEQFEPANNLLVDLDGGDAARPAMEPANNILVDLYGDDATRPATEPTNNILVDLDGDDAARPVTEPANSILVDLNGDDAARPASEPANNILVDLDGDDAARPATDEGVLFEERSKTANNLLVDLDGGDVGEDVQQDLPPVQLEISFASLI